MTNQPFKEKSETEMISYDQAYDLVRAEVDKTLSASPFVVREYMKHLALSTGKNIRAASLLTCAMGQDDQIKNDAVKLAAAIELLHLATLVHDDVIDNATLRRGQQSLQKKYGKRTAGSAEILLCIALKTASEAEDKEAYASASPDYMSKVCLGELNQHINNGNVDFLFIGIKDTAKPRLFAASFHKPIIRKSLR